MGRSYNTFNQSSIWQADMSAPSNVDDSTLEEISRYDSRGPAWYWNNLSCGDHTGTHFDAPIHWITGKDYLKHRFRQPTAGAGAGSALKARTAEQKHG